MGKGSEQDISSQKIYMQIAYENILKALVSR